MKIPKVKVTVYEPAVWRWGFMWNDYDYRRYGGKRYRIGAAVLLRKRVVSVTWAAPGYDFGLYMENLPGVRDER